MHSLLDTTGILYVITKLGVLTLAVLLWWLFSTPAVV